MWATVQSVTSGTQEIDECPICDGDRTQTTVLALTPDGVVSLGRLTECDHCEPGFKCFYCGAVVTFDASDIWRHVMDRHGRRAGD
jgi:hypothetical protein